MEDYIELNKKNTELLLRKGVTDPSRYDRLEKNRYSIQLEMLSSYISKDSSFLDIGIRDGAFLLFLKKKGYTNLYGVDLYERSVEVARKNGIDCEVANAQTLSLNKKFDVITLSHVLEHCPDPNKVLDNISMHLNTQGVLLIEVPIEAGEPVPTEKDAHYYNFNSYEGFVEVLDDKWVVLEKFVSKKRIKVVLRRI